MERGSRRLRLREFDLRFGLVCTLEGLFDPTLGFTAIDQEAINLRLRSGLSLRLVLDQSIEFEFSLTGLSFRYKGPSYRVGQALQNGYQRESN